MTGCIYKLPDGRCDKPGKYMAFCIGGACASRTPTNGDRIRGMSDEELASFLTAVVKKSAEKLCENLKTVEVDLSNCDFMITYKVQLDWLKSPVEVDNGT